MTSVAISRIIVHSMNEFSSISFQRSTTIGREAIEGIVRIVYRALFTALRAIISPSTVIDTVCGEEAAPHDAKEIFSN